MNFIALFYPLYSFVSLNWILLRSKFFYQKIVQFYAFWYSVLNNTSKLCSLIEKIAYTEINIDNWKKAKEIQKNKQKVHLLELGFATFLLNRTNRSGIINAGVIGGIEQKGKYKMDCRFNKKKLIKRIKLIAKYKNQIELFNLDALEIIDKIEKQPNNKNTILYFDPPYYSQGNSLYMNHYKDKQHTEIANRIKSIKKIHWLVSYDDTLQIKKLYNWALSKKYSLTHFAYKKKEGKETLFYNPKTKIPAKIS